MFFTEVDEPVLQHEAYHFCRAQDVMPGHPDFMPPMGPPLLVTSVGKPIFLAAWERLSLQNGDSIKPIFLEHYFDKAYKANQDGSPSSQETGILSEYGDFFPTEPGRVILTTKPDPDQGDPSQGGMRGECTVFVIGASVDKNHDGTMDPTFSGPDNTSSARPLEFWINNDIDDGHAVDGNDFEEDDLRPADVSDPTRRRSFDYEFKTQVNTPGNPPVMIPSIPCKRDLEDYARLWIPGLSTVFSALPNGYTVDLRLSGDAEMNFFQASEVDGGTRYLTDEANAQTQVQNSVLLHRGKLSSVSALRLSGQNGVTDFFLFCGSKRGSGTITVEVKDADGRVIAETSAFVRLRDIKEMYERWTVNDIGRKGHMIEPTVAAYPASDALPQGVLSAFRYAYDSDQDTTTPYILFVHGWNMAVWEKDRFAETAFKRLYWQGYQGRFGSFRWPTDFDFEGTVWDAAFQAQHFDRSEFNAWKSGEALRRFVATLNTKHPGKVFVMAHSMGNIVAGEALRLAGATTIMNTYVASQAALSGHLYNATLNAPLSWTYDHPQIPGGAQNYGPSTPNVYGDWLTSNGAAVLRRVNFYNPNDWALAPPNWEFNQIFKPADGINHGLLTYRYGFYGTPYGPSPQYTSGSVDDSFPWKEFAKVSLGDVIKLTIEADRYEIMSFGSEARCKALGTMSVGGAWINVNLASTVPAIWPSDPQDAAPNQYSRHKWHSAQFRSTNMRQNGYWQALLGNRGFNIQ